MNAPAEPQTRFQFSMRLVLLITAAVSVFLGFYVYRKPTNGRTTSEQASRIKLGMSEFQVTSALGIPLHRFEAVSSMRWILDDPPMYAFSDSEIRFLDVMFDENGKVVQIDQGGRFLQRASKTAPPRSQQPQLGR